MAVEIVGGAELRFRSAEERQRLGDDFRAWITQVEDDRRQMILDTYVKVQENLDGRSIVKSFPWYGASNAFAPLTGTYADALQSRLFEAATAHDPTNLVLPRGAGEIIPGVNFEKWATWWQHISRWAEKDDVDQKSLMETVTLLMTHFGDSWVYLPWEEQVVADVQIKARRGKEPEIVKTPRLLYSKPMPKVLHPKDVFIRWDAGDHQLERLVGFQWDLDLPTLDEWIAKGLYDEEIAESMRKKLLPQGVETKREQQMGYFRQLGTRIYTPDEFEEAQKRRMKLHEESGNRTLKMLKMFARVDMDGDGIPEDTVFDVVKETGEVPLARYANYAHRERPLIHYWFKKRPGAAYNIGVGEMMLNLQDIINTEIRDHFDNNKVQNTSIFLIKKNSGIKKGHKVYPSATFWVNNPKEDFQALTLGQGRTSNGLQAIPLLEQWGQFIVGLSSFQLGQEPKSRTPATTMSASLQQANVRPQRIIEVMRGAMLKQHKQIMLLYYQNGDSAKLAQVAAVEQEDRELFIEAMATIDADQMMNSLVIDPDVSSESLNRAGRRQEAMAEFAQLADFYDKINMLQQLYAGALMDPAARTLYLAQVAGYMRVMKRILDTFEERDQREIIPTDLIQLIQATTTVGVDANGDGVPDQQQAPGSSPADAAQGLAVGEGPAAGPVAPEGRPGAGQSRVPSEPRAANGGDRG